MSYNYGSLFGRIFLYMLKDPCISVQRMARELNVSRRTIQGVIRARAGKSYNALRQEILVAKTRQLFAEDPSLAIKEVSFAVGFVSARSFARAIRRASGLTPEDLRSCVAASKHFRQRASINVPENAI
jgi:transcriptional regulator GlxA family with amidase domain